MELKGSKTEQNLRTAFAGESQARNKYTYFASKAKKEGFVQIANIFTETADNEKEHAKIWFKLLGGIGTTAENLLAAAAIFEAQFANIHGGSFVHDGFADHDGGVLLAEAPGHVHGDLRLGEEGIDHEAVAGMDDLFVLRSSTTTLS